MTCNDATETVTEVPLDCEICDTKGAVVDAWVSHAFQYGAGAEAVSLECRVPAFTCGACGEPTRTGAPPTSCMRPSAAT
jgi:hypothetical protein